MCRVTVIPHDEPGLLGNDLLPLWNTFDEPTLTVVELAVDFGLTSGIDGAFVRDHSVFGKARRCTVGSFCCWDAWGSRRGPKWIRSYYKEQLCVHRLELQFHRSWLKMHGVNTPRDFRIFVRDVPRHHLLFARLDLDRVSRHLERAGHQQINGILSLLEDRVDGLLGQCAVLRTKGRLKNVSRMLVPLRANRLVREALREWAATWPKCLQICSGITANKLHDERGERHESHN